MRRRSQEELDHNIPADAGRVGYIDVMNRLQGLVSEGKQPVDIVLLLGEEFPRDMVETALQEARLQGIF